MSAHLSKITKLSPLVTRILGCNPGKFTLQGTNTYLIGSGKQRILLDTGDGTSEYETLLGGYLRDNQLEIGTVLLSHWHPDHVGGVDQVLRISRQVQSYAPAVYKRTSKHVLDEFGIPVHDIHDKHVFRTDGASLVGLYTPGHADDHFVFWLPEERAMFSADNVLGEGSSVFNDLSLYMKSLQLMLDTGRTKEADNKVVYPGHGPVIDDGNGRIQQYMQHRLDREREIYSKLAEARQALSVEELTARIYQDLAPNVRKAAERVVALHLDKLYDEKRVQKTSGGKWRVAAKL